MSSSISPLDLQSLKDDLDTFWLMFGAILVFFMQCGFAMLEVGSVSKKNTKNILMKNIGDAALGAICWWLLGFGFSFGETSGGFIGTDEFLLKGDSFKSEDGTLTNGKQYAFWFFQYAFAATASTIVSGTISERTSLNAYVIYTIALTSFIYPVVVHWGWASGWASSFIEDRLFGCGLLDFAGSGVVHMTGGIAALCASYVVGPRIGRFNHDGSVNNLPQQSPVYQTLGTLILWMGWYGFNGVSTLAIIGASGIAAKTMVTTTISAASAGLASVVISRFDKSFWDFGSATNGVLAGLVGITASCSTVEPEGAFVIGIISAFVYLYSSKMLLKFGIFGELLLLVCSRQRIIMRLFTTVNLISVLEFSMEETVVLFWQMLCSSLRFLHGLDLRAWLCSWESIRFLGCVWMKNQRNWEWIFPNME